MRRTYKQARNLRAVVAASALSACFVDKSDIEFVDDDRFTDDSGGGVSNNAGVTNQGGSNSEAGEGSGGSSEGGSKQTGGSKTGGSGGSPSGGTNPGAGSPPMGGMGGSGGVPPGGYPCPSVVRPMGLIANFDGLTDPMEPFTDEAMAVTMGFYVYPMGNGAPMIRLGDNKLTIESNMISQPSGVGMWMSACLDAMAAQFSRVTFDLGGTRNDGEPLLLRASLGINETKFADPQFQTGGCVPPQGQNMMYCRPAGREVMVPLMGAPQSVTLPFSSFADGSPVATIDPKEIVSIEWGFIYLNGEPAYGASITVDNVRFQ